MRPQEGGAAERKRLQGWYFAIVIGVVLSAIAITVLVILWDELQNAQGYGYLGAFVISIVAGITIIPMPSLPIIFTLGAKLDPVYLGLLAGIGETLGSITVYLTGVGGHTIWSTLRSRQEAILNYHGIGTDAVPLVPSHLESRRRAFFARLISRRRRWGGIWPVFAASAFVFSPFYIVALGAGALRIGLVKFVVACWAGKTVKGLTVAFAGYLGLHFILRLFS